MPPFAAVTAAARCLVSAAVLVFSSARLLWDVASFPWQALPTRRSEQTGAGARNIGADMEQWSRNAERAALKVAVHATEAG